MKRTVYNLASTPLFLCFALAVLLAMSSNVHAQRIIKGNPFDLNTIGHGELTVEHRVLSNKLDLVLEELGLLPCGEGTAGIRFVVVDGEVCDNHTGLFWQKAPDRFVRGWQGSLEHCQLNVGGRLPHLKELLSLMDYSVEVFPPGAALPDGHPFENVFGDTYWTATPLANSPDFNAWTMFLGTGSVSFEAQTDNYHAWCVTGGI